MFILDVRISQTGGNNPAQQRQTEITNWNQFQNELLRLTGNRELQPATNNILNAMSQISIIIRAASNPQFMKSLTTQQRDKLNFVNNQLRETLKTFIELNHSLADLAQGPR